MIRQKSQKIRAGDKKKVVNYRENTEEEKKTIG